jgi:hypothetical protein
VVLRMVFIASFRQNTYISEVELEKSAALN